MILRHVSSCEHREEHVSGLVFDFLFYLLLNVSCICIKRVCDDHDNSVLILKLLIVQDITDIIANCASTHWADRKVRTSKPWNKEL